MKKIAGALAIALLPWWVPLPAWADVPEEDSPEWSCVDDGNRVCGPGNANGAPAGCYDDGGVLFAEWPCTPWNPSYGHRHGDGTTTYPNGDVLCDDGDEPDANGCTRIDTDSYHFTIA